MEKIDERILAQTVADMEGRKVAVDIAQIAEVQRCLIECLAHQWATGNEAGVIELLHKHRIPKAPHVLHLADVEEDEGRITPR